MAAQPIGPRYPGDAVSSACWYAASPTCNCVYLAASVRAGITALALLVMLVLIALF